MSRPQPANVRTPLEVQPAQAEGAGRSSTSSTDTKCPHDRAGADAAPRRVGVGGVVAVIRSGAIAGYGCTEGRMPSAASRSWRTR